MPAACGLRRHGRRHGRASACGAGNMSVAIRARDGARPQPGKCRCTASRLRTRMPGRGCMAILIKPAALQLPDRYRPYIPGKVPLALAGQIRRAPGAFAPLIISPLLTTPPASIVSQSWSIQACKDKEQNDCSVHTDVGGNGTLTNTNEPTALSRSQHCDHGALRPGSERRVRIGRPEKAEQRSPA
jgi:hypothetical protein